MDERLSAVRTGASALVRALASEGVRTVFGAGSALRAEAERAGLAWVELGDADTALAAASGYARASGRPAVAALDGPVEPHLLAPYDDVPLLVLAAPGPSAGSSPALAGQLPDAVHEAFARWAVERPAPVLLTPGGGVLAQPWDGDAGPPWPVPHRPGPDPGAVVRIVRLLGRPGRVVIVAGKGCLDAGNAITRLAERVDAPVLTTESARGVVAAGHPLAAGVLGDGDVLLAGADLVLALGTGLAGLSRDRIGGALVRVDLDPARLHRPVRADLALVSDVSSLASALLGAAVDPPIRRGGAVAAAGVAATAQAPVEEADVLVVDRASADAGRGWSPARPRDLVVVPARAAQAAVGVALARPDARVGVVTVATQHAASQIRHG